MKKRVFIVHGWDGVPESNWFPWLKKELEDRGYGVFVPQLPDAGNPRIYKWVPALAKVVGVADEETYFVGHSMGCQTIARYIESLSEGQKVGGAVFVAGFFKSLSGLEDEEGVRETEKHWLGAPPDLIKVRAHLNKSVAIFSDNDPYVPLDNQDDFRDKLGSQIIIEHNKGHFNEDEGVTELPSALESILDFSNS
ncbi:MAG: alpha/beta fold hydrolase [Patescibacteria group bacterium]